MSGSSAGWTLDSGVRELPVLPLGPDPALIQLLKVWNAARGADLLPRRSQLNARALAAILPQILICERQGPERYFIRLAGGLCQELLGQELTGKYWADISDPAYWPERAAKFGRFLGTPCGWQTVTPVSQSWGQGQSVMTLSLPLAGDGGGAPVRFISVVSKPKHRPLPNPFRAGVPLLVPKSSETVPLDLGAGLP